MEEKAEKVLRDQRKALSHFLQIISNSTSADNIANAFKLFLMYDGKVQKFMNQIIEHQRITKEIQDLNKELSFINNDIKNYVNNLNKVDCNLTNLMTQSSIYKSFDTDNIIKNDDNDNDDNDDNKDNDNDNDKNQKQQNDFSLNEVIYASYNYREGRGVKQINLVKNMLIKEQIPISYPIPQPVIQNKSILQCSVDKLKNEFLNKIKDSKDDKNQDDSDSDDDQDEDSDNSEENGLDDLF